MERWINTFKKANCFEALQELPNESIDLIIADPPYNLSKGSEWKWDNSVKLEGMGGNWNKVMEDWDTMTLPEYWQFTELWLNQAKRVLKPTGSIWVFGTYHNMGIINVCFQKLEIEIINEIIWYKRNAFPNLSGRRFTASHETLLWGHNNPKKRKYLFNYDYSKNGAFPEDNLKKPGTQMRTVWDIPNNKEKTELKYGNHPTQKPLRILRRIILATTNEGDVVLSPFGGVGSECVAAKELGRHYVGFEIKEEYYDIAIQRLNNTFSSVQNSLPFAVGGTDDESTN